MIEIALFTSQFAIVMLLGLQSLNVNNGHHMAAFLTSFGIGAFHLVLYKVVPNAGVSEAIAYLLGGPLGIVAAMWLHPVMVRRGRKKHFIGKFNIDCGADGL